MSRVLKVIVTASCITVWIIGNDTRKSLYMSHKYLFLFQENCKKFVTPIILSPPVMDKTSTWYEPISNYINFEPTLNDQKLLLLYIIVSFRSIIWAWSHNSYKRVSTKFRCSNIKIWHLEEISITNDAKKMKDYQISKIVIALYYCKLSANSLAMITQFL